MNSRSRRSQRRGPRRLASPAQKSADKHELAYAILQPWLLSDELSKTIRSLLPRDYLSKMRWMFKDYGCFRCTKRRVLYGGNGFCRECRFLLLRQVAHSLKRHLKNPDIIERRKASVDFIDRGELASKMLSDLIPNRSKEARSVPVLKFGPHHGHRRAGE